VEARRWGFALPGELQPVDGDPETSSGQAPEIAFCFHRSWGYFVLALWGVTLYYYCNIYSHLPQVAVSLLWQ